MAGMPVELCVHRKGATRALPPGHPLLPDIYGFTGQPVLIQGEMGTCSYVPAKGAMKQSFGSCCHGTSRALSRTRALKIAKGRAIHRELEDIGVFVQSRGKQTLKEEMPQAYKNISQVVEVVHKADLARKVTRLIPTGIIIRLNKTFTKRSPLSLRF